QQVLREQQNYPQDLLDDLKNMVKPENQERWWRTLQLTKDYLSFMALLECILKITCVDIEKVCLCEDGEYIEVHWNGLEDPTMVSFDRTDPLIVTLHKVTFGCIEELADEE
ncbi:MAG: hypothetical protein ACRC9L_10330, partial [Brevinema sp.]